MGKCDNCNKEIKGKLAYSVIHTDSRVYHTLCNTCYTEKQETRESFGSIIAFFIFTAVMILTVVLLRILQG